MSNALLSEIPKNILRILYVTMPATLSTCLWFHDANKSSEYKLRYEKPLNV